MTDTIKLIIEIPQKTYLEIKDGLITRNAMASALVIEKGVPLPKGHGRLIDADKLYKQFGEIMDTVMREPKFTKDVEYILRTTATIKSQINDADTIIEADEEEG